MANGRNWPTALRIDRVRDSPRSNRTQRQAAGRGSARRCVVLNEKLLEVMGDDVTQEQAFAHANDVLKNAVGGDITTAATSSTSRASSTSTS